MNKLRVAVVGVGHLGQHHARILSALPDVELVGVADASARQCAKVAAQCGTPAYEDYQALISHVDAATIAVPTSAHFAVASAFLRAGKSLLVEKPLTASVPQADELVDVAWRHGAILQVGHIERFNPVLQALPPATEPPRSIEARREGPYSFRSTDIGVVFDLMIHDLDLVLGLVGEPPVQVIASAWSVFGTQEDVASAHLTFCNGAVAHLVANRAGVTPRREMTIRWADSTAELDFAARRSVTSVATAEFHRERGRFARARPDEIPALQEAMRSRFFEVTEKDWSGGPEQLRLELEHFVSCVRSGTEPIASGRHGRDAVRLANLVLDAAHQHPASVPLPLPRVSAAAA